MGNIDNIEKILSSAGDSQKDIFDLPEGHFERFEAKIPSKKSGKIIPFFTFVSVAAAIALVVIFGTRNSNTVGDDINYFAGVAQTPEAVYDSYIAQISQVQKEIEKTSDGDYWIETFDQISEENVPLMSTLPEELPTEEAYRIVSAHYSTLLSDIYDFQKVVLGIKLKK